MSGIRFGIIAAGEGSRLSHEGVDTPKPLVEVDGIPMIGRLAGIFSRCGAVEINIITNGDMPAVSEYVRSLDIKGINLIIANTSSSMHSFHEVTRGFGDGKFVVTTVDTVFREEEFKAYLRDFEDDRATDGYMGVTRHVDDEKPLYVATDTDMRVTGFHDSPAPGVTFVSAGIYGLTHRSLEVMERCIAGGMSRMRNFQRALVDSGLNLRAWDFRKVIDVDHARDIREAEALLGATAPV